MTRSVVSKFSVSEFNLTFSWERSEKLQSDRPENAVVEPVFYVFDKDSPEYIGRNELINRCLNSNNDGLVLSKPPLPDSDGPPCDMSFLTKTQDFAYCASELVVVSEARNLELYVNRMYETTAKGSRVRINCERPDVFYQSSLDLSQYVSSGKVAKLKFVSMPDKKQLKVIAVIFAVSKYSKDSSSAREMMLKSLNPATVDMDQVKTMITSMALSLPTNAERLMGEIDRQQQVQAAQLQHVLATGSNINQNHIDRLRGDNRPREDFATYESQTDREKSGSSANGCFHNGIYGREASDKGNWICGDRNENEAPEAKPLTSEQNVRQVQNKYTRDLEMQTYGETEPCVEEEETEDDSFSDLLSNYLKQLENTEPRNRSQSDGSKALDRWEAYLRSRIRASQRMNDVSGSNRGKCKKESLLHGSNGKRCQRCGCPGCLMVYSSITTNMHTLEERIMTRIDSKLQDLRQHIDSQFETFNRVLLNQSIANLTPPTDIEEKPKAEIEEAECVDGVYKSEV